MWKPIGIRERDASRVCAHLTVLEIATIMKSQHEIVIASGMRNLA